VTSGPEAVLRSSLAGRLLVVLGGLVLALGAALMARGSRTVSGVTLIMLAQIETIAAPVLTCLVWGERTTPGILAGGAMIMAAVVMQAVDGAWERSKA
jgi:drug/metabolite transporter, DME family